MRRLPNGAASFATAAGGEKLFVKDLVKTAAEKAGMSQKETKRVVNAVFKTISEAVIKGKGII